MRTICAILLQMNLNKLKTVFADLPKFRLKQAFKAIFNDFAESWDEVTVFPKDLRAKLNTDFPLGIKAELIESSDGKTIKALVSFEDTKGAEAVLMHHSDSRNTVCVSSQIGCAMGCEFCATGDMGFKRNLTSDEIVMQVLLFSRLLKRSGQRVTNVTFMGMGEPFLNYDEMISAAKFLNKELGIAARHISISTCGIVGGILKFMKEPFQFNLAISLHAPNNELRSKLMPVNRRFSLEKVLQAVAAYIKETNRKVMIEYLLIKDVNDSAENAKELVKVLKKYLVNLFVVNLIPYNPTGSRPEGFANKGTFAKRTPFKFEPSSGKNIAKFKAVLEDGGIEAVQRFSFGQKIAGACGQLGTRLKNR
ncbi:23S rRNA (adenine(2503)-C(2))-methyltransferase [Candidatus Peregrinibacteria bacterium RIFCSPLOWO2_01_FULL_39_12]|nr:MAG: 23S rRNA (adenine(2503)-C(2))-methyltransferase [Candidatus Peregrinibacteria bacterium RIFCSPLOWO2_01_FULL_39_12]